MATPYPPPPKAPSEPPAGHKQCDVCRMIRHHSQFGNNRSTSDGLRPSCKDCVNQAKRMHYDSTIGRIRPYEHAELDTALRSLKLHNMAFLKAFFHTTEYSISGPAYDVHRRLDYTYTLSRIPNSPIVELRLDGPDQDTRLFGISLLHQDIGSFLSVLLDFRLEHTTASMHMAKILIYNRP
jgi:hypothetical protein